MITTRVLPEAEWPRLKDTGCEVAQAYKAAAVGGCVVGAENEAGELIGVMFVTFSARLDGAWTREDYRNGSALRRLGRHAMQLLRNAGASEVFAPVSNAAVAKWLKSRLHAKATEELLFPVVRHG